MSFRQRKLGGKKADPSYFPQPRGRFLKNIIMAFAGESSWAWQWWWMPAWTETSELFSQLEVHVQEYVDICDLFYRKEAFRSERFG